MTIGDTMKNNKMLRKVLPAAILLGMSAHASAALTIYQEGDTSFTTDGLINTFYTFSDIDKPGTADDREQSRVRMGFLPNILGFNFRKENVDGLTLGARSSYG